MKTFFKYIGLALVVLYAIGSQGGNHSAPAAAPERSCHGHYNTVGIWSVPLDG